jgi:putative peptidoglycan lipid II flippase
MIGNIFIVAFVFLTKFLDKSPAFGFSIAVLGCGIIQMLWVLIPSIQEGYVLKLRFPKITPQIKAFFIKVGPAALGAGIVQVNILVDMLIASSLPKGYISYLDYAERLNQLPLSVIGTAMSTVLLPLMSRQVAAGKTQDALSTQKNSIEFAMLLTLPSTCGLILWSVPIVGMIYQYGMFTAKDTVATANALTAFASGLPAYILIKIFSTTFFSNKDTKTPVVVAVCAVFLNIILNLLFIQILGHVGLALATSITAWINALTLGYILFKRGLFTLDQQLGTFFTRLSCAILLAMPFLLTIKKYLDPIVCYTGWIKGVYIIIAAMIGVFIFAMTCWLTGAFKLDHFRSNFSPART